jgi:hypothetical protein
MTENKGVDDPIVFNQFFHEFIVLLRETFPDNPAFPMLQDLTANILAQDPQDRILSDPFKFAIQPFVARIKQRDESLILKQEIPELASLDLHTAWPMLSAESKRRLWDQLTRLADLL